MDYNFDILIAGCNTNCRHCYVDGGPGKRMQTSDFDLCIDKLQPVFKHFGSSVEFTLDHEAYGHPDLLHMFQWIRKDCWPHYSHHGSTTGIAFNHRNDKETLWQFQQENDIAFGCVTLHGGAENHNMITRNANAFAEAIEYARFIKSHHGKLYIALMLSSLLVQDREQVTETLRELAPDELYFAIPLFAPSKRMLEYQSYRATYDECVKLRGYLAEWGVDEEKYMRDFEKYNSHAILERLKEKDSFGEFPEQESCYLSLHSDLELFYGNTGAELERIGNMKTLSSEEIIRYMETCRPNYNFFPNYFSKLPEYKEFLADIEAHMEKNHVYPDMDSFLTYHMMKKSVDCTIRR